jgi:hypothetical protein
VTKKIADEFDYINRRMHEIKVEESVAKRGLISPTTGPVAKTSKSGGIILKPHAPVPAPAIHCNHFSRTAFVCQKANCYWATNQLKHIDAPCGDIISVDHGGLCQQEN